LKEIHEKGYVHKDLHPGNILIYSRWECRITDLGLCQPVSNQSDKQNVYGVIPYVAPEVLKGKDYTPESDIYSFGIIAHEMLNELPTYHDLPHDVFLVMKICKGLRPKFKRKVPRLLEQLIDQCLDANPSARPTANELCQKLQKLINYILNDHDAEFTKQYNEAIEFNKKSLSMELNTNPNPQAVYTSRLLDFNNLPEPQNSNELYLVSGSLGELYLIYEQV
ncbi:11763_t:CDS:1, partial [Funneliformis geosporum]